MAGWAFSEDERVGTRSLPAVSIEVAVREVLPQAWDSKELRAWCTELADRIATYSDVAAMDELRMKVSVLEPLACELLNEGVKLKQRCEDLEQQALEVGEHE